MGGQHFLWGPETTGMLFLQTIALVTILGPVAVSGEFHCPENWKLHDKMCYNIATKDKVSWYQAREECVKSKSTLVKIEEESTQDFLKGHVNGDVWIGAHDQLTNNKFQWLDDPTEVNFTNWDNGEPNNLKEDCAILYGYYSAKGSWDDQFCNQLNKYICEKVVPATGECEEGWETFAGKCYFINDTNERLAWGDARKECQKYGADLVTIETKGENDFLTDKMPRSNFWIGFHDTLSEGNWRWLDSVEIPPFHNWNMGEPNNAAFSPPNCVNIYPQSYRKGRWSNVGCQIHLGYICEKVMENVETGCEGAEWSNHSTSCYYAHPNGSTWAEARMECKKRNADLLKIDDQTEQFFINSILKKQSWIGLNSIKDRNKWVWLDEDYPANWTNWYSNKPSSLVWKYLDCVLTHAASDRLGKWENHGCKDLFPYICESAICPPRNSSWQEFQGHCYNFNLDATSWTDARQRCGIQQNGADLVVIETPAEQNFINDNIKEKQREFWIGFNSIEIEGRFVWLDTKISPTYTNWDYECPKEALNEACVEMKGIGWSRKGKWNDEVCLHKNGYICQKDATGDNTYYDFRYKDSVYKLLDIEVAKDEGSNICKDLLGQKSKLAEVENQEELDRLNAEINSRMVLRHNTNFWIEGNPKDNSTFMSTLAPWSSYTRPVPLYAPGRLCMYLTPTRVSLGDTGYKLTTLYGQCCQQKKIICEKKLNLSSDGLYDFRHNKSIYKFFTDTEMSIDDAKKTCMDKFDGVGQLAKVNSDEELQVISTELKTRHMGSNFEYWIFGDPTDNNTYTNYNSKPSKDDHCLMLAHKDSVPEAQITMMELYPNKCQGKKRFICERNLEAIELTIIRKVIDKLKNREPDYVSPEASKQEMSSYGGCQGPCLGLAVAFPIVVFAAVVISVLVTLYVKRSSPYGFMFNKASDEVYLTADA